MRNVEFITNGFAAPMQGFGGWADFLAELRSTGKLGWSLNTPAASTPAASTPAASTPASKVSKFMVSTNADPALRMASVKTAEQRGLPGIEQTVNFFAAVQEAFDPASRIVPEVFPPANIRRVPPFNEYFAWYKTSGNALNAQRLLKIINIMINTASSRVGTNMLTSYFIGILRSMMSSVTTTDQANSVFSELNQQMQLANEILRAVRG